MKRKYEEHGDRDKASSTAPRNQTVGAGHLSLKPVPVTVAVELKHRRTPDCSGREEHRIESYQGSPEGRKDSFKIGSTAVQTVEEALPCSDKKSNYLDFHFQAASVIGGKPRNEDRYFAYNGSPNKPSIYAVFDGHGGVHAAEFASQKIKEEILKNFPTAWTTNEVIQNEIQQSFLRLHDRMLQDSGTWPRHLRWGCPSTAGTTASVLVLWNGTVFSAFVGDSRTVMFTFYNETFKCVPLSQAHNPSNKIERASCIERGGKMSDKGNRVDMWIPMTRVNNWSELKGFSLKENQYKLIGDLSMTRALGNFWSFSLITKTFAVSPIPEIRCYEVPKDETFVFAIVSDGISDLLTDNEIGEFLSEKQLTSKIMASNNEVAMELCDKALLKCKRCPDNATAVLIWPFTSGENSIS